jgi:shikimate kinase
VKNKIIYLAGFMGAGKSTVGPILANTLGWDFYDLDKVIEKKAGKKIKEIFEKEGEPYFRMLESETLRELSKGEKLIVSLGGGTMISEANLKLLRETGKIVYLKVSPESLYKRLRFKRDRPALTGSLPDNPSKEELMTKINDLMEARKPFYEKADIIIEADHSSVGKTVDIIAKLIAKDSI